MVQLVGILNVTPDSFSDGGQYFDPQKAVDRAEQLFEDGASIVDIGAESTRPGAIPIGPEEEWRRLEPVLGLLLPEYEGRISVDTHHPKTIERVFKIGSAIINDVTGMNNPAMVEAVVRHQARCIVSHLPGLDIQAAHNGVLIEDIEQVKNELLEKAELLQCLGMPKNHIILDPGIGFGKTQELNADLLTFAKYVPGYDVMIGYSRKRFLGDHRMDLDPNLAAGVIAINNGARFIRVHDVAGHKRLANYALALNG